MVTSNGRKGFFAIACNSHSFLCLHVTRKALQLSSIFCFPPFSRFFGWPGKRLLFMSHHSLHGKRVIRNGLIHWTH